MVRDIFIGGELLVEFNSDRIFADQDIYRNDTLGVAERMAPGKRAGDDSYLVNNDYPVMRYGVSGVNIGLYTHVSCEISSRILEGSKNGRWSENAFERQL